MKWQNKLLGLIFVCLNGILFFGLIILAIFFQPILLIALLIKLDSKGPIIYFSNRIGQYNNILKMPKFRTMHINSPQVASD